MVSERLGHANISITLQIYGHLLPNMQAEATQKMDYLLAELMGNRSLTHCQNILKRTVVNS